MKNLMLSVVLVTLTCGFGWAAAADSGSSRPPLPARPNFIIINIDDLGYADIGPYGSTVNKTPHLDRLAAEGRKLTCFYAAPVCSPSRAALMTGCYPKRVLPIGGVLFPHAVVGLNPDEVTIAEVLKKQGYATACFGKWHLGDHPEFLPGRQGFDSYFGLPYSNDMGPVADGAKTNPLLPNAHYEKVPKPQQPTKATTAKNADQQDQAKAKKKAARANEETGILHPQPPLPLLEQQVITLKIKVPASGDDDKPAAPSATQREKSVRECSVLKERVVERVRAAEQFTLTQRYTDKACQFVRDHKNEPFFLYLPHTAVHFPHYPAEPFRGRTGHSLLADWVEEVDASVGQILNTVRELGLEGNTLVLFTSDNGGSLPHGSNNAPLRGGKNSTWEGGMRACTIARWPGVIPAGTASEEITGMMDVLPTFAALAGAPLPEGRKLDGVNITAVLRNEPTAQPLHEVFYFFRGFRLEAIRRGPWKLHLQNGTLFNLRDDIGETTDVAAAHTDEVTALRQLAQAMNDDLGTNGVGPGCRPLGRVEQAKDWIAE